MEIMSLIYLALVAFGGIAYDVYQNPQTLIVDVLPPGSKVDPSLDRQFLSMVVATELDHVAKLNSMLAHPAIKSADAKDLPELIAEDVGGAELVASLSEKLAEEPSRLRFGIYNEDKGLTVYVTGHAAFVEAGDDDFDIAVKQQPNESAIALIKRATVEGASHIDPYLSMLYLVQKGVEESQADGVVDGPGEPHSIYTREAMKIAQRYIDRNPSGHSHLLARLTDLVGIIQFSNGDYAAAEKSFADALRRMPPGDGGPTYVLSTLNLALAEISGGKFDAAATRVSEMLKATDNMEALLGYETRSSEGVVFALERKEVDRLAVTAFQALGGAALGQRNFELADKWLSKALEVEPRRMTALWWRANMFDLTGDRAKGDALRASMVEIKQNAHPYLENATAWSTVYFGPDKISVLPSLYAPGALPPVPHTGS